MLGDNVLFEAFLKMLFEKRPFLALQAVWEIEKGVKKERAGKHQQRPEIARNPPKSAKSTEKRSKREPYSAI